MACEAPGSAPPAAAPPRARLSVSKDTLSAPGMLFRNPVRVTGEPGPASLRAEAFGSMTGAYSYSYTQEEDTGMWAGGTTAGGVVLLPPESDMYEVGYDFAVPGRVYSSCYFVAGPGVRFAAGNPYPNNGSVASGYSWGATASELVFNTHGTTGGVGSNAVKFTSTQNIAFRSNTNYWGTFDHAITADRTWTFPDESGTVALTSALFTGGPFTAGSVIFSAGTLVLAENNANFFWDNSDNQLSITTGSGPGLYISSSDASSQLLGIRVENLDGNVTSHALIEVKSQGAAGGDAFVRFGGPVGINWYVGFDNSDSDAFKIGDNATVGSNVFLRISTAGAFTLGEASLLTATVSLAHASSAFLTSFTAGVATAAVSYTLPTAGPLANGYALTSTTAGVMSWTALAPASGWTDSGTNVTLTTITDTVTIGTTTVVGILNVQGNNAIVAWNDTSTQASSVIVRNDLGAANQLHVVAMGSTAGGTLLGLTQANGIFIYSAGASNTFFALGTSTADPLIFVTNGAERCRFLSSGELGIGTTTPTFKLDVSGSAFVDTRLSSSSTVSAGLEWNATATGGRRYAWLSTANGADPGGGNFAVYDLTGSAYRLLITSGGNVGIGTGIGAPDAKLDVLSTTTQLMLTHTDGTVNCSFAVSASGVLTVDPSGTIILFDTVNEFRLNSATGVPQINLQNNGTSELRLETSSSVVFITNLTNNDMVFRTNSVERFRLKASEVVVNDTQADVDFRVEGDSVSHLIFADATATTENLALCAAAAPNWQTMDRGIFLGDASTAPTGNPASGGFLYSEAGALKWRGSGGTTTTIAAA